ncbi:MAG: hypothetical protein A2063_06940 [Gallionellales bacterium GWA2_60_142]|jgi:hypothetical protein|nr:MAG: hypothetical protein A2063_06940 [Gallionellales bacterium GWA2_60_142]HCI14750.1 hypothetical protein [Gallionellaceae bacterium]
MLTEWLTWLAADCPPPTRKLGYLRESIAIRTRYRRCKTMWQPHLTNSRAALLDSLQACSSFRTALVFGSGLLLDIPLDELARRFKKVYLVDIVHLPEVKRAVRHHANVRCIDLDVTGFIEHMEALSPERLELPPPKYFLDEPDIDWVASVNLLSQLPLLPVDWLRQRFPELSEAMLEEWGTQVMRQHLDYLAAFAAPTCLLADMEQVIHTGNGEIIERIDFASRLRLDDAAPEQWRWNIAPPGEIAPDIGSFHRVAAHCRQ